MKLLNFFWFSLENPSNQSPTLRSVVGGEGESLREGKGINEAWATDALKPPCPLSRNKKKTKKLAFEKASCKNRKNSYSLRQKTKNGFRDSNLTESKKRFKAFRLEALKILKTRKTQEVSESSRNISNKIKTLRGRI